MISAEKSDRNNTITYWARKAVAPWIDQDYSESLEDASRSSASTFLFRFHEGQLSYEIKPVIDGSIQSWAYAERAKSYYSLFKRASQGRRPKSGVFAINVCDGGAPTDELPIFGFQRPRGSRRILMPDPEMLNDNELTKDALPDILLFEEKKTAAIFVGSTTGGGLITLQAMNDNTIPRIRSARYFKPHSTKVLYLLPNLVHIESPYLENLIRAEGYSNSGLVSWREQLTYKFILSIDGHGAACSRVRIGLGSNSVLIKYTSPYELYYFTGLISNFHFLEIGSDEAVLRIVQEELDKPNSFSAVALHGAKFERSYLCDEAITLYCAELLDAMIR